jgi:hypothetical protein
LELILNKLVIIENDEREIKGLERTGIGKRVGDRLVCTQ